MPSLFSFGAGSKSFEENSPFETEHRIGSSNGDLRIHRRLDSFGNVLQDKHYNTSGSIVTAGQTGYVDEAFAYTGRFLDSYTDLQNNLNRWYDPRTGRWMSEDPIGFEARDANLYRYVGNSPANFVDPRGLKEVCGFYVWLYTGGWCADEDAYNDAIIAAGDLLYCKSPVRGGYAGVGVGGKLPGRGSPAGQAGVAVGWTVDSGAAVLVEAGSAVRKEFAIPVPVGLTADGAELAAAWLV